MSDKIHLGQRATETDAAELRAPAGQPFTIEMTAAEKPYWYRSARRVASDVKQRLWPSPEVAAWNKAVRESEQQERFTRGRIRLLDYDLEYVDLLTLCPQWRDIFVRQSLRFASPQTEPRILDCGANIGLSVLYFKKLYPRARITAYEADPDIFEVLTGNMTRNGSTDVELVSAAVWTENGSVSFSCEGADAGSVESLARGLEDREAPTRSVPSVRLRDALGGEPLDLVKMDIEGAELEVLKDCASELQNVKSMLFELHELDPSRRCTGEVFELLEDAGFCFALDDLTPLPWRRPVAAEEAPFPGSHLSWATLVRAWRE